MNILTKFKNLLFESLKENKKLIIGLYILFIVCFIAGWVLSGSRIGSMVSNVTVSPTSSLDASVSATELFIANEWGGIVTYAASIFFGLAAIIILAYNGLNLGMMGQLFNTVMPNGGLRYIIYIIPHGIFEITATVLESAAGILLFMFIWKFIKSTIKNETGSFSETFEKNKKVLIQSIILMIFSTVLLLIAAPIEAYFSVPFSEMIVGP